MINITAVDSELPSEMDSDSSEGSIPDVISLHGYDSTILAHTYENGDSVRLANSDLGGVAAASMIATANKKRRRPYSFETNPTIRKRQQTRLTGKLRNIVDEYSVRVGQQAIVLIITPGKEKKSFKVFGASPLEDIVRSHKRNIIKELDDALAEQVPEIVHDHRLYELPPLVIDGIPTPVEKMTQAQLRTFIPYMLKYSTGRGKPGWGRESTKPVWWPKDVPWSNVRSDSRSEEDKLKVSWTHALRRIVRNCYRHHKREDLLMVPSEDEAPKTTNTDFTSNFMQSANSNGALSIIHIDPGSSIATLSDGTRAEIHTMDWPDGSQLSENIADASHAMPTIINLGSRGANSPAITVNGTTMPLIQEATINQDGQIVLTGDAGQGFSYGASVVTIPMSLYESIMSNVTSISQATIQGTNSSLTSNNVVIKTEKDSDLVLSSHSSTET